jgi:uncharacterized membrane protein
VYRIEMLRRSILAGSIAWAAAIPLAALAVTPTGAVAVAYPFALAVYAIGSAVCHQLPSRSFFLNAVPLPVCARCLGIYLGGSAAAVALMARPSIGKTTGAARWRRVLLAAALPTAITVALEWVSGTVLANGIRAAAGVPLGAAVVLVVCAALPAGRGSTDSRS